MTGVPSIIVLFFTSGGLILLTNVALIMDSKNETCPVPRDIFQYFWGGAALSFFPGGVGRGSIENFPGWGSHFPRGRGLHP